MDTSRVQTLEALETFIQLQKTLLMQQQADIERLRLLKVKARKDPEEFMKNLEQELDDRAFRLSEQGDCRLTLPPTWDWAAFENADTTPLRTFAHQIRDKILQRAQPSTYQQSPLSDLQKIVKEARVNILDPVLAQFQHLHTEDEEESEPDPEELRKEKERAKIKELKKRKIRAGGLKLPSSSSAGWGSTTGVFIRHDVDDETVEVDMDIAPDAQSSPAISYAAGASPPPPPLPLGKAKLKSYPNQGENLARQPPRSYQPEARPLKKVKIMAPALHGSPSSTTITTPAHSTTTEELPKANVKESRTAGKPKPETYKQAWSVSEQNLLEQLLEQVPEGEKFRWQKISRAMGGRRTPRQVASRVQKYFQKLKKFGVEIDLG